MATGRQVHAHVCPSLLPTKFAKQLKCASRAAAFMFNPAVAANACSRYLLGLSLGKQIVLMVIVSTLEDYGGFQPKKSFPLEPSPHEQR
eukprot:6119669-Amphidinium_carterae.1